MGNAARKKKTSSVVIEADVVGAVQVFENPGEPGTPLIVSKSSTNIEIKWTIGTGQVGQHEIYYTEESNKLRRHAGSVGGKTTNFTIEGLKTDTQYKIEVVAVHAKSINCKSKPVFVTAQTEAGNIIELPQPRKNPRTSRHAERDDKMTIAEAMLIEANSGSSNSVHDDHDVAEKMSRLHNPSQSANTGGSVVAGMIDVVDVTDDTVTICFEAANTSVDNYRVSHYGPDQVEVEDYYLDPGQERYTVKGLKANVEYTIVVTPYNWDSGVPGIPVTTRCVPGVPFDKESKNRGRAWLKYHIDSRIKPDRNQIFEIKIDRKIPMLYQCCSDLKYYVDQRVPELRFRPEVEFTDSTQTYDLGGPLKEYFTLLMEHIMIGHYTVSDEDKPQIDLIFEGEDDHKVPTHNQTLVDIQMYTMIGRMVQHSIIWGGPGLAGLAQSVKDYVTRGSIAEINLDINDVPDCDIRENIESIMASSGDDLKKLGQTLEVMTMLADAGFVQRTVNDNCKHYCIQQLLLHNIIKRRQEELDQFRTGFNSLSLAEVLCRSTEIVRIIFPRQADIVVTLFELSPLLHFDDVDTAQKGMTFEFFNTYLQECDRRKITTDNNNTTVSLGKLLQFITGCPTIPPKSYNNIKVMFHSQRLPIAETCFQEVCIPTIYKTYKEFRDAMDGAVLNCVGFGLL
ncbi:G2/M phase-specific E3 ubiquitin-protein ligase-like [Glandiceps talaboti]